MSTAAVAGLTADAKQKYALLKVLAHPGAGTPTPIATPKKQGWFKGTPQETVNARKTRALGATFAAMSPETRAAALTIAKSDRKFTFELYTTFGHNNEKAVGITFGRAAVDGDAKNKSAWQRLEWLVTWCCW